MIYNLIFAWKCVLINFLEIQIASVKVVFRAAYFAVKLIGKLNVIFARMELIKI
jgi:hypothetical protein